MSRRYLKKISNSVEIAKDENEQSNNQISPSASISNSKKFNIFNLLDENSSNDEIPENCEGDESNHKDKSDENTDNANNKSKKKRKKKKNRANAKSTTKSNSSNKIEDEIEKTLEKVNDLVIEPDKPSCSSSNQNYEVIVRNFNPMTVMQVELKFLSAVNELKRKCGGGNRNVLAAVVGEKSKNRNKKRYLRKTWLTSLTDRFLMEQSGLSMAIDPTIKTIGEIQYFVFVHSSSYMQVQNKFLTAVESQNPDNIVSILNAHPYHIDTILQFAELCKLNEDLQTSAQFVERAVHCFECTFHPSFNLISGDCRLSYKNQTNRPFFIALFRHLMFISGRACYRTSLEMCKVLLSLDPEGDPLAIVLVIDLFALRAKEYQWLIDFCMVSRQARNLNQLPNIAFSLALAHFHLGDEETASELLQEALIMFPGVLNGLLEKCSVQADTRLLGYDYFNCVAKATTSIALEKLQTLYVIRCYHLWKDSNILGWLENNAHAVMDRIDSGDAYATYCKTKRCYRYQGQIPKNVRRHIILSDIKEVSITHPGIPQDDPIFSYDPLPPADTNDIYGAQAESNQRSSVRSSVLSLFLSTLFPNNDPNLRTQFNRLNIRNQQRENPRDFD
ncbi:nuclear localized protein 1 [Cotesia typhae]|uniref:nuclear localized protein 1 n=1 Tax=Cotesia typhae TaxID=2053667 RepID=UPI003D68B208